MGLSFMSVFQVFGVVSNWAAMALADGKISYRELVQLGIAVAEALDLPLDDDVVDASKVLGLDAK
jgi:hypothetical protein